MRSHLHVPRSHLPDEQVRAVWLSLDEDQNGTIDAGEFGRFMRRARLAPHHGQSSEASDGHPGGTRFVPPGGSRKHVDVDVQDVEEMALQGLRRHAEAQASRLRQEAARLAAEVRRRERRRAQQAGEADGEGDPEVDNFERKSDKRGGAVPGVDAVPGALPAIGGGLRHSHSEGATALPRARQRRSQRKPVNLITLQAYGSQAAESKGGERRRMGAPRPARSMSEPWTRQLQEEKEAREYLQLLAEGGVEPIRPTI